MPKGLNIATNYYNRIEAWKDWQRLARQYPELAKQFQPAQDAGWKTIDRQIAKLRAAAEEQSK